MPPRLQPLSTRLNPAQLPIRTSQRTYAIAATADPTPVVKNPLRRRKGGDLGSHLPKHVIPANAYIPAYPYGDRTLFKQANHGLYGHQMIHFGNNVSHKTETKTRRYWKPNVLNKSVYSVALKKRVKLRVTSRVLKVMDREGGLDAYLLKEDERRVKELGPLGWALRWTLMQKPSVIEQMRHKAAALGLPQDTIDAQWPTKEMLERQKGLVRATDLLVEEPEEAEEEEYEEVAEVDDAAIQELSQEERRAMRDAGKEYERALKAAERYLARNNVDSIEEGLKLAFIRAKERQESGKRLRENFAKKLDEQFTAQDVAETRAKFKLPETMRDAAVKKVAYNQRRRQQIEQYGSYEAWRANVESDMKARLQERYGSKLGDEAATRAQYAKSIADAETASTNSALDAKQQEYLTNAISKADKAIQARSADGKAAYIDLVLDEMREKKTIAA
ncbi:hypothetical protein DE146DRAFT_656876 [Phaeosphaeria sp. MPI-PUGE-AT-0046c]|nr:hypothetical protein DE146DRAFT_656876 [Phaeosphaeria sp. MPI-PUGE-AT-0046c]